MQILLVSDLHYTLKQLDWVASVAADYDLGDEELVGWIGQHRPDIVLCGHVHQSPFASEGAWIDQIGSTLVLNAGRQIGPVPTCIELDTEAGLARWSSLAGVEERSFAGV